MNRRFPKRRWLAGGCLLVLLLGALGIVGVGWLLLDHKSPLNQASAIQTTKEWARLAEFPATRADFLVEVTGNSFTREFSITFRDTPANVRAWIAASPGPASATPTTDANGWTVYSYPAGGGAMFAEVRVSPSDSEVRIRTYWS